MMKKYNRFETLIALVTLLFAVAIKASADPIIITPVLNPDTIHLEPIKENDPGNGNNKPEKQITAFVKISNNQMQIHFSQPVSCEIQLVDLQGQPQIIARMREEDFAVLDVSRLHGRFQLVIFSDYWFATKPYWFP